MAWTKIPAENHPLFLASLPRDPRASTVRMFGGLCTMVNGQMACGLFARSVFVNLDEAGQQEALALDGAEPFDPMGKGHALSGKVMLPEAILDEPAELRDWLRRAVEYTASLPPKKKAGRAKAAAKPARAGAPKAVTRGSAARPKAGKAEAVRSKAAASGRASRARARPARASRR